MDGWMADATLAWVRFFESNFDPRRVSGLGAHRGRTSSTTALASRQYRENPAGLALTGNVIDADPPGPSTSLAHGRCRLSLSSSPHHRAVTRTHGGAPRSCHSRPSTVRVT